MFEKWWSAWSTYAEIKITPIPIETIYMTPSQLKLTLTKIDTKLFHVLTDKNQRIKLY